MNISVGDTIPVWEMSAVSAEKMKTMAALLRDPNPLHWDKDAVAALPMDLGRHTINQGPLGLSYIVNMLHAWAGPGTLCHLHMTFPQVVLDNDKVTAKGIVTNIQAGIAHCEVWLEHDIRGRLLEGSAKVLLTEPSAG